MKWILLLLLCLSASAQLPIIPYKIPSGASTWYPTNASNPTDIWADLTPLMGAYSGSGLAGNNQKVDIWTNFISNGGFGANAVFTADQTLHPTNFISGGGGSATSPRILFTAATDTRLISGNLSITTNLWTFVIVANCTASTGVDKIVGNANTTPLLQFNALKLEMSQGSTVSSAATLVAGQWYVISAVFAAGASSHIDTNGVQMVSGNAGTGNMLAWYIAPFGTTATLRGNIARIWGWRGILSAGDLASAVAQCKTDFNIQ